MPPSLWCLFQKPATLLKFWNFKRKWGISSLSFQHPEAIYICMYSHIHISGLAERDVVSCIKAIPSLRSRLLTDSASSPQLFLHQGLLLWKTIFHCLRVGGGLGVIHVHYICFYYSYYCIRSSSIGSQGLGDPDLDLTASLFSFSLPGCPFCPHWSLLHRPSPWSILEIKSPLDPTLY